MRVLQTVISSDGFNNHTSEPMRMKAAYALLREAKANNCDAAVLPAGFWSARDNRHRTRIIATAQQAAQAHGVTLIAGVDVLWPTGISDSMVRNGTIPFFGFAVTNNGTLHGPWRQLSVIGAHTTIAPTLNHGARIIDVAKTRVLVLICGEMLNANYRMALGSLNIDLVVDIGHIAYKRARQTARVVAQWANKPVLHVQHLRHKDTMVFFDGHGHDQTRSAWPSIKYSTSNFWYGWTIRDI